MRPRTEHGKLHRGCAHKGQVINSVGAGDSMVAGFMAGYTKTGDYQKAEKDYLFLCHLTPTSWNVVLELARLYHQMNRTREALELLEPCTKISPKDKTLEQKSVLLEIREQYQAMDKKRGCEQ